MAARNNLLLLVIAGLALGMAAAPAEQAAASSTAAPSAGTSTADPSTSSGTTSATTHKTSSRHHKKKPNASANTASTTTGAATTVPLKPTSTGTTPTGAEKKAAATTATGRKTASKSTASSSTPASPAPATTAAHGAVPVAPTTTATASTTTTTPISKHKKTHTKHVVASKSAGKAVTPAVDATSAPLTPFPPSGSAGPAPVTAKDSATKSTSGPTVAKSTPAKLPDQKAPERRTVIIVTGPPPETPPDSHSTGGVPEVETGLPVARHSGFDPTEAATTTHDMGKTSPYQIASSIPLSTGLTEIGTYTPRERAKIPLDDFPFTNFTHRRNIYPWKTNIFTTQFWIGEGSTPISSTDNVQSAWDQDWRSNNGGSDAPGDRQGYMPAHHASRMNPFYVALPFNDLKYPEIARQWLPPGWYKRPREGKQVSACQHHWIEIKNAQGKFCYAQWEDVGPLNYSDAPYVFGDARPTGLGNDRAGLDVSPAVADYLDITGKNCITRWRFVDDADVVPGKWLQYDEEALIFRAMHEFKDPNHVLPIQRATAPIDDDEDLNSTKKRIGAAKG